MKLHDRHPDLFADEAPAPREQIPQVRSFTHEQLVRSAMTYLDITYRHRRDAWAAYPLEPPEQALERIRYPRDLARQIAHAWDGCRECPLITPCKSSDDCRDVDRPRAADLAVRALNDTFLRRPARAGSAA